MITKGQLTAMRKWTTIILSIYLKKGAASLLTFSPFPFQISFKRGISRAVKGAFITLYVGYGLRILDSLS
jgi:hypothetical protein